MADSFRIVVNPAKGVMYVAGHDELIAGGAKPFERSQIVCREFVGWVDETGETINENMQEWFVGGDYVYVSLKTYPATKRVVRLPDVQEDESR